MDHDFGRLKWTYLTKLTIAGMIVPKSASVIGPFPPATNGSLVLDQRSMNGMNVARFRWRVRRSARTEPPNGISVICSILAEFIPFVDPTLRYSGVLTCAVLNAKGPIGVFNEK